MLVLLSLHCFGLLQGDSCPSVDVWGWKKPREQASSFCIFWWRLVLWQMCWYTVEIRLCERDRESHRRTRERLFPATPALSSGTTLPLFSPLSQHLLILSSFTPHCHLPTLNHSHPLSSPDPTLQPTDRQHFTSSFAHSLAALLAFLSLSSSKCDRHMHSAWWNNL